MISRWFLVFCVLAGSAAPAHAYLDPGTGSMMVQAIVAAAAAAIGGVSLSWRWVKTSFLRMIGAQAPLNTGGSGVTDESDAKR